MNSSDEIQPRGFVSTVLISIVGSFFAGFLWIGRPRLAIISLVCFLLIFPVIFWFGMPPLGANAMGFLQLAVAVFSASIVLPFRRVSRPHGWYSRWYAAIPLALLVSMFVALSIRSFIIQPFSSPAGSMAPTLMEGDNFFVYKAAYGYSKQSFPLGIIDFEGRVFPAVPTRGDVVVFKARQGQVYVKRIIGMPGETIQMRDGVVYINGEAVRQNVTDEAADPDEGPDAKIVVEILPNGMSYKILDVDPNSVLDNTREYLVPEGEFFMLGDHRDNSNDSRLSLGSIPFENLIGRAERIFANTNGRAFANRRSLRATSMKGG